jgi:3,4-dihydroxy 2-butanone 4-phosphate synthase / GTP cyclohydrolase II
MNGLGVEPEWIPLDDVSHASKALGLGGMVTVVDDLGTHTTAAVAIAGRSAKPAVVNFMAREARGVVSLAVDHCRADQLGLEPMAPRAGAHGFHTVSIEAAVGVTTGISAADRARTIRTASSGEAEPADLVRPGHVFPIASDPDGVLGSAPGLVEACVDLARIAGMAPLAVGFCHLLDSSGESADLEFAARFAHRHGLPLVAASSLASERVATDRLMARTAHRSRALGAADLDAHRYASTIDDRCAWVLTAGDLSESGAVRVTLRSGCDMDILATGASAAGGIPLARFRERAKSVPGETLILVVHPTGGALGTSGRLAFPVSDEQLAAHVLRDLGVCQVELAASDRGLAGALTRIGIAVEQSSAAPRRQSLRREAAPLTRR